MKVPYDFIKKVNTLNKEVSASKEPQKYIEHPIYTELKKWLRSNAELDWDDIIDEFKICKKHKGGPQFDKEKSKYADEWHVVNYDGATQKFSGEYYYGIENSNQYFCYIYHI